MSGPLEFTFKGQSAFVLCVPVSHSHGSIRRAVRALSDACKRPRPVWSGRRAQGPSCTFGIELRYSTFENPPPDSTAVAATVANSKCSPTLFTTNVRTYSVARNVPGAEFCNREFTELKQLILARTSGQGSADICASSASRRRFPCESRDGGTSTRNTLGSSPSIEQERGSKVQKGWRESSWGFEIAELGLTNWFTKRSSKTGLNKTRFRKNIFGFKPHWVSEKQK